MSPFSRLLSLFPLLLLSVHLAFASSLFPTPRRTSIDDATLQICLLNVGLDTVSPTMSDPHVYYLASQSDNLVFHYNPSAIVYAKTTADVQNAVNCAAASNNIAVAARSGGHSFGGYGSGGMDGSLVIDLSNMNRTFSYPSRGTAEVQPGARLGDVAKDLYRQRNGQRGMAHGTCPTVGAGGHALCGGFGPMSRKWGMAMDQLLEADVVLADGSVVTASESENPELFWGLKGSGSFFGIVTRFLFKTQDASHPTTFFEYEWSESLGSPKTVIQLMLALQEFAQAPQFPEEMGFHIQLEPPPVPNGSPQAAMLVSVRGAYLGPKSEMEKVIQPLWSLLSKRMIPMPKVKAEKEDSYIAQMEDWDDFGAPGQKLDTIAERKRHNNFVVKTLLTLDHTKGFTEASLEDLIQFLWKTGRDANSNDFDYMGRSLYWEWNIYFELFGGPSAAYRTEQAARTSSFAHRDGMWLIQMSVGTVPDQTISRKGHKYLNKLYTKMQGTLRSAGMQQASYSCYTDPDLSEEEWRPQYYGDSIVRLERLKAQVDPNNLFRNPQTLGTKEQIENRLQGKPINLNNASAKPKGHQVHPSP